MAWETLDPAWTGFIAKWKARSLIVRLRSVGSRLAQDFVSNEPVANPPRVCLCCIRIWLHCTRLWLHYT